MLIILGTLNLTGAGERLRQGTSHAHAHAQSSSDPATFTTTAFGVLRRGSRSVLVGVVHGLAGSAAVALLVLTTLDQASWALAYLGVFGFGTVAGMMLITATMALPIKLAMERFSSAERVMARATGALSLAFGIFLAYRIGFVDGLLLADPEWSPK
jgi:high-affinity nickel-transport protein